MPDSRMRQLRWIPVLGLAALAAALACTDGGRETEVPERGRGPELEVGPEEAAAEHEIPVMAPAEEPAAAAPETPATEGPWTAPLSDLLRLREEPAPKEPSDPLYEPGAMPSAEKGEKKSRRLQVEVDRSEESSELDPDVSRKRTEAGVSVEVGENTRVRGGVRVEEEGEERDEPVPMIGIEKRF
jgi:hypothetical protein